MNEKVVHTRTTSVIENGNGMTLKLLASQAGHCPMELLFIYRLWEVWVCMIKWEGCQGKQCGPVEMLSQHLRRGTEENLENISVCMAVSKDECRK